MRWNVFNFVWVLDNDKNLTESRMLKIGLFSWKKALRLSAFEIFFFHYIEILETLLSLFKKY